jgi:hypothetical protein
MCLLSVVMPCQTLVWPLREEELKGTTWQYHQEEA